MKTLRIILICTVLIAIVVLALAVPRGDGGDEGEGTGQINIAIPITSGANINGNGVGMCGYFIDNSNYWIAFAKIDTSSDTCKLEYWKSTNEFVNLTGEERGNETRALRLHFWYEVD